MAQFCHRNDFLKAPMNLVHSWKSDGISRPIFRCQFSHLLNFMSPEMFSIMSNFFYFKGDFCWLIILKTIKTTIEFVTNVAFHSLLLCFETALRYGISATSSDNFIYVSIFS